MPPPANGSDDALLLRSYATDGDAAAFAELVRRYADMVYATARRVTGSATAAEDVAQDCFLRLAQCSAAVSGSLAAWLHRTSLNRSLEVVRSERARKQREAAAAVAVQGIGDDDSRELIARVDEALAALPDDLRVPLTEHFLCGRSQVEIATESGLSQSTISRRIEAGLDKLRRRLRAAGATPAAVAALPLVFGEGAQAAAPQGLRAALTKIGLSGVRPATAAAADAGISDALIGPVALISSVAVIVLGGGLWFLTHPSSPSPARVAVPATASATQPGATQSAAAASADEDVDDFDGILAVDDEHDDDKDDDKDDANDRDNDNEKHDDERVQPNAPDGR
jgi:RNA polymerase sigma factor (sigma-70 family)